MFKVMKMSKFNYTTYDPDGNLIVYNFLTGLPSLTKVAQPDVERFMQLFLTSSGINNVDCEGCTEAVESMLKTGILVADGTDEDALLDAKHYDEVFDSKLVLFILPTGECNFRCKYCNQSTKVFSRSAMATDSQNALIKFIQREIPKHTGLHVTWFGGEPLMEPNIIKNLSEKFIKICSVRHLPYTADIISNGYKLNADMFDMLYNLKVYDYMITLDGYKELHDKYRFTHDGAGSYDVILANLLNMRDSKKYKFAKIRVRVNITGAFLGILDDFVNFIATTFAVDPRFTFQFQPVANFSGDNYSDDNMYSGLEVMQHLLKNEVYIKKLQSPNEKLRVIVPSLKCTACLKNGYAITSDLKIHKCYVHLDMSQNIIGHITSKGDLLVDEALHQRWYVQNKLVRKISTKCIDCFFKPSCHVGDKICPVLSLNKAGRELPCPMESMENREAVRESILDAVHDNPYNIILFGDK